MWMTARDVLQRDVWTALKFAGDTQRGDGSSAGYPMPALLERVRHPERWIHIERLTDSHIWSLAPQRPPDRDPEWVP